MESTIKDYMSQYGRQLQQQGFVNHLLHCKSRWPSAKRQNCNKGIRAFKGNHGARARYDYGDQCSSFHHCSKHYTTHSNVAAKDRRRNDSTENTHKTTPWTSQRWSNPRIKTCRKGYFKLAGPLILRSNGVGNGYAGVDQTADWLQAAEIKKVTAGKNPTAHQRNPSIKHSNPLEVLIERVIFNCRFITLLAVVGSLAGSVICFLQGSAHIAESFLQYFYASSHGIDTGHIILSLVEAIDIFLAGTVLLIFGMGLYELFVNIIGTRGKEDAASNIPTKNYTGSNLFGLFRLQERPLWLKIGSLDELKTKVGHVIVMILLVGMFEKSKKVPINTGFDLLCFSGSILMASGCLFFLSKLYLK